MNLSDMSLAVISVSYSLLNNFLVALVSQRARTVHCTGSPEPSGVLLHVTEKFTWTSTCCEHVWTSSSERIYSGLSCCDMFSLRKSDRTNFIVQTVKLRGHSPENWLYAGGLLILYLFYCSSGKETIEGQQSYHPMRHILFSCSSRKELNEGQQTYHPLRHLLAGRGRSHHRLQRKRSHQGSSIPFVSSSDGARSSLR